MTGPAEMAELITGPQADAPPAGEGGRSPEEVRVIDALSTRSARTVDEIAARAGLGSDAVRSVIGLLGLEGAVAERGSGWVAVPGVMAGRPREAS